MAYQDTFTPAEALRADATATRRFLDRLVQGFYSLGESLSRAALARARYETMTRLQSKSDAELAQLGLRRADIVRHVFGDLYYP
jgi:uncharacterized protein YjiS (DUF1127 family)